jgi:hypothetical protein
MTAPIDYTAAFARANPPGGAAQGKGIPVDSSGMVSTWSLPTYMLSTNGNKAPVLWYDTGHHAEKVHVPGPGEHSGPGSDITQVHSFDINSTPEQIMKEFAAKSQTNPQEFAALQKMLADAGFFGVDSHVYGGWQKAAQAALGRNLSQPELTQFIDQFHQQQIDSFNQSYSGTGNPVDKSDPRSSASAFVSQDFKPEMQKHQVQGYADAFLNMFLTGPSSAPNVNVDQTNVGY